VWKRRTLMGSGTERFELWKADALLLSYRYSNRGYRRLAHSPTSTTPRRVQGLQTECSISSTSEEGCCGHLAV
jgi:hypothetical protein